MASENDRIIKLPLFSKVRTLMDLPAAGGRKFGIVEQISPHPDKSMGYLVEVVAPRRVKVLAWLALGGAVYACDAPLSERPGREPDCGMQKDGSTIEGYVLVGGTRRAVMNFGQRDGDYKFTCSTAPEEFGPYAHGFYDLDELVAVIFLVYRELAEEGSGSHESVADIMDVLRTESYPDALEALIYRGSRADCSAFERFAAASLREAGAEFVRGIAAANDLEIRRIRTTGLYWTVFNRDELDSESVDILQAVEGALNRLVFMERALTGPNGMSPRASKLSAEACERAATECLATFVSAADDWMHAADEVNSLLTVCNATGKRGGEWDMRTRFARAAEEILPPFNFNYVFDCNAKLGVISVDVSVPTRGAFPAQGAAKRAYAQAAYALRLAALLAAAGFGSGVGVSRVQVNVRERMFTGDVLAALAFSRTPFNMGVMPQIRSGVLAEPGLPPAEILAILEPAEAHLEFDADGGLVAIEALPFDSSRRGIRMEDDDRALPDDMAEALHARTARELDIFCADDDPLQERVAEVIDHAREGSPAAVPELADIVATYDSIRALEGAEGRPLYCQNMIGRILAGRLAAPGERLVKAPDGLFQARSALCRAYRQQGNFEDAESQARALIELAPTSFEAYHSLSLVFTEQDRDREAAQVIIEGMVYAVVPDDIFAAYYRLGFTLWQAGEPATGLACYAMIPPHHFFYAQAQDEARALMESAHIARIPSLSEARAALRADGVPVLPTDTAVEAAASAAVALADAGFFHPALALTHFVASLGVSGADADILYAVTRSFRPAKDE